MKKSILVTVLIFFVVVSGFAAPRGPKITLKNSTGYEVSEIYVSPADADYWGEDYLVNTTLDDGDTFSLTLPSPLSEVDTYDFQLVDIEGDSYNKFDLKIKSGDIIEITLDDLYEDYSEDKDAE